MKLSKRQQEIEARKAADPIAQAVGRDDIDYESDELPTAPRPTAPYQGCTCMGTGKCDFCREDRVQ
jgi:hypothetical protein